MHSQAAEISITCLPSFFIFLFLAGTTWGDSYEDFNEKSGWDRVLATNVKALFYLTAGLTPLLAREATNINPGRVINISSVAGLDPKTEDSELSAPGMGLWSCELSLPLPFTFKVDKIDKTRCTTRH